MHSAAVPVWLTALISLGAAMVGAVGGGFFTLHVGVLNDQRTRRNARIDRIRRLAAQVSGVMYVLGNMYWREAERRTAAQSNIEAIDVNQLNEMMMQFGVPSAELGWMTNATPLEGTVQELLAAYQDVARRGPTGDDFAIMYARLQAALDDLEKTFRVFAAMSYERADRFLSGVHESCVVCGTVDHGQKDESA